MIKELFPPSLPYDNVLIFGHKEQNVNDGNGQVYTFLHAYKSFCMQDMQRIVSLHLTQNYGYVFCKK